MHRFNSHVVIAHSTIGSSSNYERVVIEAIDYKLSALGERARESFYISLQSSCGLSKERISDNIDAFMLAVGSIFGSAADLLEKEDNKL